MAYRVELPPEGECVNSAGRFSHTRKTGDTGDSGDSNGQEVPKNESLTQAVAACPKLPKGVRLLRYTPKQPPVAIAPVSIVTDVNKFIQHLLHELDARLHHPVQIRAGGSVFEILAKLADAGLEVTIEAPLDPPPKTPNPENF